MECICTQECFCTVYDEGDFVEVDDSWDSGCETPTPMEYDELDYYDFAEGY